MHARRFHCQPILRLQAVLPPPYLAHKKALKNTLLVLHNIPYDTTHDELVHLMQDFGRLKRVEMQYSPGNDFTGKCFVTISDEGAELALKKLHKSSFKGNELHVLKSKDNLGQWDPFEK